MADITSVRIDKWLWAARFFKHRTAATAAVDGGHVQLNGLRVKPAREVKAGDRIELTLGEEHRALMVRGVAEKRGPASVAQQLYEETPESIAAREKRREARRFSREPAAELAGRPTKRDRRSLSRLRGQD
jgi:ribosome-associated heat shock protein Hsp15